MEIPTKFQKPDEQNQQPESAQHGMEEKSKTLTDVIVFHVERKYRILYFPWICKSYCDLQSQYLIIKSAVDIVKDSLSYDNFTH